MNTKKITALALAALMAAGSTSTVFAAVDSSNKDKVLEFVDSTGKIYYEENDDGLLVVDKDGVAPGESVYFLLKDNANVSGIEDKDRDRIKVYADWKMGKDYIKDIEIVYKKGEAVTSGSAVPGSKYYTVKIGGKKLEVVVGKGEDLEAAIKRVLSDEMKNDTNFLKDERAAELKSYEASVYVHGDDKFTSAKEALEAAGWTYGTYYAYSNQAYKDADVVNLLKAAGGNNADATNKFYNAAEDKTAGFGTYLDSDTNSHGALPSTCYLFTNGTKFVDSAVITTVEKLMGTNVVADIEKKENVFKKGNQLLAEEDALTAESTVSVIKGYVKDGKILTEEEAKKAAEDAIATQEASDLHNKKRVVSVDSDIDSVAKPDFTYWVKIDTKESFTTKEQDIAGTLYLGTSKNSAEDKGSELKIGLPLSNRIDDNHGSYVIKDGDTIYPDANGAVKFEDDAEEVTIYFGSNEDAWFTFNAAGQSALNLAYNTKFNKEIADLFPKANIDFISWIAEPAANRTGDLYITAKEDTFLYQVTEDGKGIKEVKGADYDEDEGAWHIRTRKLGSYVISDMELDTTAKVEDKDEASSNSSTSSKPNGDKHNPDTGR